MARTTPKKPPLRLEYLDPKSLASNELNWKKHTQRQHQALDATLDANGWAGALLYNERTKKLIDGHGRKDRAIKRGEKLVPVLVGSWTEEQEKQLLATLDPIGAMAQTNSAALSSLLASTQKTVNAIKDKHSRDVLTKLNTDLSKYSQSVTDGETPSVLMERRRTSAPKSSPEEDEPEEEVSVYEKELKDDVIFASDLPWGIPELRSDLLCSVVPDRVWDKLTDESLDTSWYCYSAGPSTFPSADERGGGILGFFTEDFRFSMAWNDTATFAKRLIEMDFSGVCLPDFSQWGNWPAAVNLHNLYRSRWCGRYWQEAGIPVVPILQAMGDADEYAELCFGTLPAKPPVVAVQCRTGNKADYWQNYVGFLKLAIDIVKPATVVVYGGEDNRKYLEGFLPRRKGTSFVLLPSYQASRLKKRKKK